MKPFPSPHSVVNRFARLLWSASYILFFRPTPRFLHAWRRLLVRCWGARISTGAHLYPSVRIWAPWNLIMGPHSCLGPDVDCYNAAPITLGPYSAVSQYSFLCAATHDYTRLDRPLTVAPITIGAHAWVCADVFVGPGVRIGEGAVVGARSSVYADVAPWTVVAGNPARFLKQRVLSEPDEPQRSCSHPQ